MGQSNVNRNMAFIGLVIAFIGLPIARNGLETMHDSPFAAGLKIAVFIIGYIIAVVGVKEQISPSKPWQSQTAPAQKT